MLAQGPKCSGISYNVTVAGTLTLICACSFGYIASKFKFLKVVELYRVYNTLVLRSHLFGLRRTYVRWYEMRCVHVRATARLCYVITLAAGAPVRLHETRTSHQKQNEYQEGITPVVNM